MTLMTEGWRAGKFDLFRLLQTSRDASEARRLYLETLGLLWESCDRPRSRGGGAMTMTSTMTKTMTKRRRSLTALGAACAA